MNYTKQLSNESSLINLIDKTPYLNIPYKIIINNDILHIILNTPDNKLKSIAYNTDYAREILIHFTEMITIRTIKYGLESIKLNSSILKQIYTDKYRFMLSFLLEEDIISLEKNYSTTNFSKSFNFNMKYYDYNNTSVYEYHTFKMKKYIKYDYLTRLSKVFNNPISKNLLLSYREISLPTIEEVEIEGLRLINDNYKTKKGKDLVFNKDFTSKRKQSSIENSIFIFLKLTQGGFMIPSESLNNAGGRVTDSFNLMPSWIRNLVKYEGRKMIEIDYSALHPNIALNIYGNNNTKGITHQEIAENLNLDIIRVKKAHLSLLNSKGYLMMKNILWDYYDKNHLLMIHNLLDDRNNYKKYNLTHKNKHKVTSRKMFKEEVDIMKQVIERLNTLNIYPLYIYDALFVDIKRVKTVQKIMQDTVDLRNIKTIAKI